MSCGLEYLIFDAYPLSVLPASNHFNQYSPSHEKRAWQITQPLRSKNALQLVKVVISPPDYVLIGPEKTIRGVIGR